MNYEIITDNRTPIERKVTVRVVSDSVEEVWVEELGRSARETEIPGFRKSKAPGKVVEGHVGRDVIWERVRGEVSRQVTNEIIRDEDPSPLAPPDIEFGDSGGENTIKSSQIWKPGDSLEFIITYLLPPPTPEDIEKDLLRGAGAEIPGTSEPGIKPPSNAGTNPPDPRSEIPGSGIDIDS